jgi:hypothetical protein
MKSQGLKMDKKLLRRLQKLLALAERGVGGEKTTAQRMLDNSLAKNNLTIDDILGDETRDHWIKYNKTILHRRLLNQIIYSVCGSIDKYGSPRKRYQLCIECSEYDLMQITLKYGILADELDKELDLSYSAFIQVNSIFPPDDKADKSIDDSEPDFEYLKKLAERSSTMDATPIHHAITDGR